MDWIAWDNALDTGHAGMDAEHKELAALFKRLRDAVESGKGKAACTKVLDDIIRHAQTHFEREQQLMAQHHYPKADQHEAEHTMLIRQALDFRQSFDVDSVESRSTLTRFAEVWLVFHILFSDKEMAAFLAHDQSIPTRQ